MYEPARSTPLTKITASTLAGAITAILIWLLQEYAHTDIPPEIAVAIATIISAIVGYLVPLLPGEIKPVDLAPHPITTPPDDPTQPAIVDFSRSADDAMPRRPVASGHAARMTPDGDAKYVAGNIPALGPDGETVE
jgi:hypothetical protein